MPWFTSIGSEVHPSGTTEDGDTVYLTYYWVEVTNMAGYRYNHFHSSNDLGEIEVLMNKIRLTPNFTPEGKDELWFPGQPVYGSEAYSRTGGDLAHHADLEPWLLAPEHLRHGIALEHDYYARFR